jgi:hypothetical protein
VNSPETVLPRDGPGRLRRVPRHSVLELLFLMVILKIPIVYLCSVVYYAIKAVPEPDTGADVATELGPEDGGPEPRRRRSRSLLPRPHGGPARSYPRTPRTAFARAERR